MLKWYMYDVNIKKILAGFLKIRTPIIHDRCSNRLSHDAAHFVFRVIFIIANDDLYKKCH